MDNKSVAYKIITTLYTLSVMHKLHEYVTVCTRMSLTVVSFDRYKLS